MKACESKTAWSWKAWGIILLSFSPLYAQEFGGGATVQPEGVTAVLETQNEHTALPLEETATEMLQNFLDKMGAKTEAKKGVDYVDEYGTGWEIGWNDHQKRYFSIVGDTMNMGDPSTEKGFFIKREIMVKRAILRAKAEIIKYVSVEMSASDKLDVPGADVDKKLREKYEKQQAAIREQEAKLNDLMTQLEQADKESLAGITTKDRVNELLDAIIVKLKGKSDKDEIIAEKIAKAQRIRTAYEEAERELERIRNEADEADEVSETFTSSVELYSKMPLVGATIIKQSEAWDKANKTYEVAVLVCWSADLERAARATFSGVESDPSGKVGKSTVQRWLKKKDLSKIIGPRQFLGSDGSRYFLAVTARPLGVNASINRKNKSLAETFAMQMAAFSLFADVDSYTGAEQMAQTTSSDDINAMSETEVAEAISERITQSISKMKIQGMGLLARKETKHPITGQKMYVVAYGVSSKSAANAMKMERQAALSAIALNKSQAYLKGRSDALNQAVEASKGDRASYAQGRADGSSSARNVGTSSTSRRTETTRSSTGGSSTGGSTGSRIIMDDDDVEDDF